jgi:hypothetical protein
MSLLSSLTLPINRVNLSMIPTSAPANSLFPCICCWFLCLSEHSTHTARLVHRHGTDTAHSIHRHCTLTAHSLHRHCTLTAHTLHSNHTQPCTICAILTHCTRTAIRATPINRGDRSHCNTTIRPLKHDYNTTRTPL